MTIHKPVLLEETLELLELKEGMTVVDATLGGGGHAREILKRIGKGGTLIGIDADSQALERFAESRIGKPENIRLVNRNFSELGDILQEMGIEKTDAIMADLGYSSDQLEDAERGISFSADGPLDMRLDQSKGQTAADIINGYPPAGLERIIKDYGEERYFRSIVKGIVEYRSRKTIETTKELVSIIESRVPAGYRHGRIDPATRTFQAIRIEVNQELDRLRQFLSAAIEALKPGGRLAVISFHSLEDRIVKEFLRENARGCICPKDFPVCLCGKSSRLSIITKRPIVAGPEEIDNNPRSRSAKLRVCAVVR